ncbi:MAG: 4Fe-4S dicluster domain-containing protein [Deltaproteobacteria bacterium]|nr:4Fe-4S dicluster domain-containing protein [Deltaproteobacteria bacterium]
MKKLIFQTDLCIGCQNCELACSIFKAESFSSATSRIKTFQFVNKSLFLSIFCQQCEKPPCLKVCEPKALFRNIETGVVHLDVSQCNKCYLCLEACPYGGLSLPSEKEYPIKCDLCGGEPKCVDYCPTAALSFAEDDKQYSKTQKVTAARMMKKTRLREDTNE